MKKRKLRKWVRNLKTLIIGGLISSLALICFFYILGAAILQTSYRLHPVTADEVLVCE